MGWTVIRFWGEDILHNTDECVKVIEETIFDLMMEEPESEPEWNCDIGTFFLYLFLYAYINPSQIGSLSLSLIY